MQFGSRLQISRLFKNRLINFIENLTISSLQVSIKVRLLQVSRTLKTRKVIKWVFKRHTFPPRFCVYKWTSSSFSGIVCKFHILPKNQSSHLNIKDWELDHPPSWICRFELMKTLINRGHSLKKKKWSVYKRMLKNRPPPLPKKNESNEIPREVNSVEIWTQPLHLIILNSCFFVLFVCVFFPAN